MENSKFLPAGRHGKIQNSKFQLLVLIICILHLIGCAAIAKKMKRTPSSGVLEPQATMKLGDVPIPAGFKLLSQDSYSFESANMRVAVLKYQGKPSPDQVVNFYKEQMLMYNWNLLNIIEYGQRLLNFDRDTETCIIALEPQGKGTVMTISLGPKSQTAKRSSKAIK